MHHNNTVSPYNLRPRSGRYNLRPMAGRSNSTGKERKSIKAITKKTVGTSSKINEQRVRLNLKRAKLVEKLRDNPVEPDLSSEQKMSWDSFNEYVSIYPDGPEEFYKEYVSATAVKNHLLKDPLLDWLKLYYLDRGYNTNELKMIPQLMVAEREQKKRKFEQEMSQLSVLFEMGNRYEAEVISYLRNKFPGQVVKISNNNKSVVPQDCQTTFQNMLEGVPIIEQAVLYNFSNRSWGVADLIVRSDWINRLFEKKIIPQEMETLKAPKLKGNYHYLVIDIKWTTMMLRSNGVQILNSQRFPAYKGQLAIYTSAVGLLQGYTPDKAFILAKSWKYTECGQQYVGYGSFDLLGEVDFADFDNQYLRRTKEAISWVREVRYHGHKWSCLPPSRNELRPNMCNRFDTPYHELKKELAHKQDEITSIWMIGVKHRDIAVNKGVVSWSDPKCTAELMEINGQKIGPTVDAILEINRSEAVELLRPHKILNNTNNWPIQSDFDFFVDFEAINNCFGQQTICIENSKQENGIIFMIGIGFIENGCWQYINLLMQSNTLDEERRNIDQFNAFIEQRVSEKMIKNKIRNRNYIKPNMFCWGHAERSMLHNANNRHGERWSKWMQQINWLDVCQIFIQEPIVIKGAKKFNLKEITKAMHENKMINCQWDQNGVTTGLGAMIEASKYYQFMDNWSKVPPSIQPFLTEKYKEFTTMMTKIKEYNEVDCRAVREIVNYLRTHHC